MPRKVSSTAIALLLTALAMGQTEGSLFSPDERTQIQNYWSDPARFHESIPDTAKTKGLWQVRLTPAGSLWLWNYNKLRKVSAPPTEDAAPANPDQQTWDDWLSKKIRYDRVLAWQVALEANKQIYGDGFAPKPDKTIPPATQEKPGPEPADMQAAVGNPPAMAQAVVAMQYTITFDDATIQYADNTRTSPRYAYYRWTDGVDSEGTAVSSVPEDRLTKLFQMAGCTDSEARVMRAVSPLEGGFDAVNTYDTGFVSVGFIQFASLQAGAGSLGSLLLAYKQDNPSDFAADFHKYGVEVAPNGDLDVLDPSTGAEVFAADANQRIINDKRLVAVFQRAGQKSDPFCAEQIKIAKAEYYPANDPITLTCSSGTTLTGKVCDFIKSERAMAMLFDRKVNTGHINLLAKLATDIAEAHHCASLSDLAAYEKEIASGLKYRSDFSQDPNLSQPGG